MKNPATTDHQDLVRQAFPWPDDVPLPRPRFGKSLPPPPVHLPLPITAEDTTATRAPFHVTWEFPDLALKVHVREQPPLTGSMVWVDVESNGAKNLGKSVSVALLGETSSRMKRRTVALDTPKDDGWRGQRCFGSLQELSAQLGNLMTVDVFLLE